MITDPAASALSAHADPAPPTLLPPSGRIAARTRRRTAAAAGITPPAVDDGSGTGGASRPSARRANIPPRAPRPRQPLAVVKLPASAASPAPTVTIPSGRDCAEPVGTSLSRIPPYPDAPPDTTADLDAFGAAAELQFGDFTPGYSHADWAQEKQAKPACHAAMRYIVVGRPQPYQLIGGRVFLRTSTPPSRKFRSLLAKAGYTLPMTASSCSSVN